MKTEIFEIEGYWVVTFQSKFDNDDERTVLGAGPSKELALEMALNHAVDIAERLNKSVDTAVRSLGGEPDHEGLGQYVEVPGVSLERNGDIECRVDGVLFDEESGRWCWFFR